MRGRISILTIDTRACSDFGKWDHLLRSASILLYMLWKFLLAVMDNEGKMSTPKYLKCLTTRMCWGSELKFSWEFKGRSADFVQFILYPDRELNSSKVSKICGSDMAALSQYNNMSSAYSDMECVVLLKVMGEIIGCWRIFCARGVID